MGTLKNPVATEKYITLSLLVTIGILKVIIKIARMMTNIRLIVKFDTCLSHKNKPTPNVVTWKLKTMSQEIERCLGQTKFTIGTTILLGENCQFNYHYR